MCSWAGLTRPTPLRLLLPGYAVGTVRGLAGHGRDVLHPASRREPPCHLRHRGRRVHAGRHRADGAGRRAAAPRRAGARSARLGRVPGPGPASGTCEHAVWIALAATPVLALGLASVLHQPRGPPPDEARRRGGRDGLVASAGLGRADLRGALLQRRVRAGRRRAAGLPGRGGPARPPRPQHRRAARLAAAGAEHGRGGMDPHLVPAADAAAAAYHAGGPGLRHQGPAGAARRARCSTSPS